MATKNKELTDPDSCFNKAAPNEPIFILRAQDITAPGTVSYWLEMNPDLPEEKALEAKNWIAEAMNWPTRKFPD